MLRLIKTTLAGLAFAAALGLPVSAQDKAIEGTISQQFEAFKADDFAQAFTYATPSLQRFFQSPRNFGRMVTQGYPMVWRPAQVTFLELTPMGDAMVQKVQVIDQKGVIHILAYRMEQVEGGWRIGGVQILSSAEATA